MKLTSLLAVVPLVLAGVVGCIGTGADSQSDDIKSHKATKRIEVSLYYQELRTFDHGWLVTRYDAATGSSDSPTPPGSYSILSKHETYHSQKYDRDMPFTMFFSDDGMAIHGAYAVGVESWLKWFSQASGLEIFDWFGSHGCVRLSNSDAEEVFGWTPVGIPVTVLDDRNRDSMMADPCTVDGVDGACVDVAECDGGTLTPGRCAGPASTQCCTFPTTSTDPSSDPSASAGP